MPCPTRSSATHGRSASTTHSGLTAATCLDPAAASFDVARTKPGSQRVTRLHASDTDAITPMQADLAVMTGHVAQVFMDDRDRDAVLIGVREALPDEGWLVIETRVPAAETWRDWTSDLLSRIRTRIRTRTRTRIAAVGVVESWVEVTDVGPGMVSFRWTHQFEDGAVMCRTRRCVSARRTSSPNRCLAPATRSSTCGALPRRPGKELVFIAQGPRGGSAQSLLGMQLSPPWSGSGGVPGLRS